MCVILYNYLQHIFVDKFVTGTFLPMLARAMLKVAAKLDLPTPAKENYYQIYLIRKHLFLNCSKSQVLSSESTLRGKPTMFIFTNVNHVIKN